MTSSGDPALVPIRLVTDSIANAKPVAPLPEDRARGDDAPPAKPDGSDGARHRGPRFLLPEGCPVTPLGTHGELCFYLDTVRQLRKLKPQEHSKLGLTKLFGKRIDVLWDTWRRYNKDGEQTGWRADAAAEALIKACDERGVWNPDDRERGAGAWTGADGELLLHCGDGVLACMPSVAEGQPAWRELPLGLIGREVYPAANPVPRPCSEFVKGGSPGPAVELLEMLNTWRWRHPEVAPQLMLGWIAAALIGGALNWRPVCWLTGGAGTGKSTLTEKLIKNVFGEGVITAADASAAGLWQRLGQSTLPVMVDELEADSDNRKVDAVIKLARLAAGGGKILRGGADHKGAEFEARCCFAFSSINVPPLMGQDRSRIAILDLDRLDEASRPPVLNPAALRDLGARLRRRMVQGWGFLPETIEKYSAALQADGHDSRGCDVFGTLLACADIALHDGATHGDVAADWALKVYGADVSQVGGDRDEEMCLMELLTHPIDPYRKGQRHAIGEWVLRAAGYYPDGFDDISARDAQSILRGYGLAIKGRGDDQALAVAHYHKGLAPVFADSHWKGRAGSKGGWVTPLGRLYGAETAGNSIYFEGGTKRAVILPMILAIPKSVQQKFAKPRSAAGAELDV